MTALPTHTLSEQEAVRLLSRPESHFLDYKSIRIKPTKLSRNLSAFANADGGELLIGVEQDEAGHFRWAGFNVPEDANGHIQALHNLFPLGNDFSYAFVANGARTGYLLRIEVAKTRDITKASDGIIYVRRGAQNLPVSNHEAIATLQRNKGLSSFENELVNTGVTTISNSEVIIRFMLDVIPNAEPDSWLRKQNLIVDSRPTVAGIVLFADEPQAIIPKRCGIKIYRYKTSDREGSRETLDFDPRSIEGCAYDLIKSALRETVAIIESIRISTPEGMQSVKYPEEALHEVITNAVLHRDYSIFDDIHVRIFDNRVEVSSPGTLPAHITTDNILRERFARNGTIVRIINKFPNPPNKDVGEGLNTAFEAMRNLNCETRSLCRKADM